MTELVSAKGIVGQALRILKGARRTALRQSLLEMGDNLSLSDIVAAAEAGEDRMRQLLEKVGQNLGLVTANLANLFAPEKIILAGEVPSCCTLVRHAVEQGFRRHTLVQISKDTVLADGNLTGFAGATGAAYLGFLRTFPEEESTLGESFPYFVAQISSP
jgi:predicted NBD/HSP70 family sugar kinase